MSESTTVLVQTETVGATVIVTGATVIGTVPIGPQGPPGVITADDVVDLFAGTPDGTTFLRDDGTLATPAGGGGGVTDADFLVGTAHAGLSAEIVVGTSPGGELGGTWASPTVDATHSGSSHAGVQAAAEATAAAALTAHEADTTNVHGIANTAALETTSGAQAKADAKVTQTITNGVTTTAPSEDAVFDALALKQPLDADLTALAAAGNSAVLAATTAAYTTADETKVDHLTVTQAVDLDAIEARVNSLDAAVVLRGNWDASAGTFPGGGTAQAGDSYIVTVAGTVNAVAFAVGDRIVAITDNASTGTYAANWLKLDYTDAVLSVDGATGAVSLAATYAPIAEPIAAAHIADGTDAHDASAISIADAGGNFTGTEVEAALDELADADTALATAIADGDASTLTSAQTYADGKVDNTVYGAGWNADTTDAPSKNAVYDEMELRAPKASPTFTGTVTLPADQALTGNPTAPTQTQGNDSTRLATTAFVNAEIAADATPKMYFDEFRRTAGDITVDTAGSWATLTSEAGGGTTDFDLQVAASAGDVLLISVHALWGTYVHATEFRTGRIDFASIVSASPVNYLAARAGSTILGGMPGFVGGLAQLAAATVENDVVAPTAGTGGLYSYPVQAGDVSGGAVTLRPYVRVESSGRTLFASANNPLSYFVLNLRGLAAS